MRATEFLTERFDYTKYINPLSRLITDTFYEVVADEDYDDTEAKINEFLYRLEPVIDKKILAPLLKENPIVYDGVKVVSLTISFETIWSGKPMAPPNMGALSAGVQRSLRQTYPGVAMPRASNDVTAQHLKTNMDFTQLARFYVHPEAKSGIINIEIRASHLGSFLFLSDNSALVTSALQTLTSNIMGKIFHEVKHFMQATKTAKSTETDPRKRADLNRYYTGDYKTMDKQAHYNATRANGELGDGYWLNADEMDSFAANAAAEINNIFGNDVAAINNYLNAASRGQTIMHNGIPVHTTVGHIYRELYNPENQMNTDRTVVWKKFMKNVFKDVQMYLNRSVKTSQKQPAKPQ